MYSKGCNIAGSGWPESEIIPTEPDAKELADMDDAVEKQLKPM